MKIDRGGFSAGVKRECSSQPLVMKCCREIFLWVAARKSSSPGRFHLESPAPVPLKKMLPADLSEVRFGKGRSFEFSRPDDEKNWTRLVFQRLGDHPGDVLRPHCLKAAMRGLFLRNGYLQDPQEGYHLEIGLASRRRLILFRLAADFFKLPFRYCRRGPRVVAYLKSSRAIARFLRRLELYQSVVAFDDIRATRGILGHVNRQVNCETANINKSVAASERIIEQIRQLFASPDQAIWSPALRELARMRLEFPHDSLEALGQRFIPPLSKSAVNHRIRRIADLHQKVFRALVADEHEESVPDS